MRLRLKNIDKSKWTPIVIVAMIFLFALFLRSYFAYDLSASNGWIVSGGSDSYYYQRLMETAAEKGQHLHWDDMLNYPAGARNPRPPLFTFSVAVPAVVFSGLFSSLGDALGFFLIWSTAFWGALTVVPAYYIGRDMFGRRAGYVSALFLAIVPAHVERSVASLADHDSFALFFIVLTIFFIMRALKVSNSSKWVEDWGSAKSILAGLKGFAKNNKQAILFALLAGMSFSAIALAWVGYAYIEVILLVSFLILILINKLKGIDSTTITFLFLMAFSFAFFFVFPVYWQMNIFVTRFDVPLYLFLGTVLVGLMFSISRDYPWLLVLPTLTLILAIGVFAITVINPAIGEAIITGQGYFATSKLYETIAEARAPIFSNLAVSFGIVTFFLSLIGLVMMFIKIPKRISGDYIIVSIWLAIAIFMATSAGRFMFNAAPAFAISSAWVTVLIIDKLDFRKVGKLLMSSSGNIFQILRKSIKIRHVVGALFVVFLLIMPNAWSSLDAGIPQESKRTMDTEIYNAMPDFLKPASYTPGSSLWYLGSFGFSLPLPTQYFPALWDWFEDQDADILPYSDRPAYVSWWDYGFEAIQAGKHPAVADNFQQGYEIAGNMLLASSEEEMVGLMISRLILHTIKDRALPEQLSEILVKYNASPDVVLDVYYNASSYRNAILSDPDRYGSVSSDISNMNIIWRYLGMYFADLGLENETSLYKDIKDFTGHSIGYLSIDARLIPISANSVGVFYAPVKLTDRELDIDGNPADYYEIKAVDSSGIEYSFSELAGRTDINIVDYKLVYKDAFFKTMLYRATGGIPPVEAGESNDGLPGLSGSVRDIPAMPGWNLTHFIMVYRTAYFNPMSDGSGVWRAIPYDTALEYRQKINAKEMDGIVDVSPSTMYQAGAVVLKYYEGAVLSGKITTQEGDPAPGIWVTVQDKYGIPHHTVYSASDGSYSVILPPGDVTVQISSGKLDAKQLVGESKITSFTFEVTDDMASRKNIDSDGDGRLDWQLERDVAISAGTLSGKIFWDIDGNGNYTEGSDILIKNATVIAWHLDNQDIVYRFDAPEGAYEGLVTTGRYALDTYVNGIERRGESSFTVKPGQLVVRDIARKTAQISGVVRYDDGQPATRATVSLIAQMSNMYPAYAETLTDENGHYSFSQITPGEYVIVASTEGSGGLISTSYQTAVQTSEGQLAKNVDLVIKPSGFINVKAFGSDGRPMRNGTVKIVNLYSPVSEATLVKLNSSGEGKFLLPEGTYSLTMRVPTGFGLEIGGSSVVLPRFGEASTTINLFPAERLSGQIFGIDEDNSDGATVTFTNGLTTYLLGTDISGKFSVYLPPGEYEAVFYSAGRIAAQTVTAPSSDISVTLEEGVKLTGQVWHDHNNNGVRDSGENISYARINVVLNNGVTLRTQSDLYGSYSMYVPRYSSIILTVEASGYLPSLPQTINTGGTDISRTVKLQFAPVKIEGTLTDGERPIWSATIQLINSSVSYSLVSGQRGAFEGEIIPGIYEVKVTEPVANNSQAVYYHSSYLAVFVGTNIDGLTITAERRIKVEGSITGIPASRYATIRFEGPSSQVVEARGGYEAYLKEGSYSVYAYERDGKSRALLSSFDVNIDNRILDLALYPAFELTGRVRIGPRAGNVTEITVTSAETGASTSTMMPAGGSYSFALPAGVYGISFKMKIFEDLGRVKRYYLLHDESTIDLQGDKNYEPFLKTSLDNSTLSISVRDQSGKPVQTRVMFGSLNEYAIDDDYMTAGDGTVIASIHPGKYAVYVADVPTGLSYLGELNVSHDIPAFLNVTVTAGFMTKIIASTDDSSNMDYLSLKISRTNSSAFIRIINSEVNNTAVLMLPRGEYLISGETTRMEYERVLTYSGSVTTSIGADTVVRLRLARSATYSFEATWDSAERQSVLPGGSITYHITIRNTGTAPDSYRLSGIGGGFDYKVPEDPVFLDYRSPNNVAVVPVKIIASAEVKVAHDRIYIDVRSLNSSNVRKSVSVEVDIVPIYSVVAAKAETTPGTSDKYFSYVEVKNMGNIEDNYTLRIINAHELEINGWDVSFEKTGSLELGTGKIDAGSSSSFNITLVANRRVPNGNVSIAVLTVSNSSPSTSTLAFVTPTLPELEFSQEGMTVSGDNIQFEDIFSQRDLENTVLLLVMIFMTAAIFIVRKLKFGRFFR
ncbi:MAG: carboxypeptidase regulatory-like domain-containing protein [Thermoplasmata archaeon]